MAKQFGMPKGRPKRARGNKAQAACVMQQQRWKIVVVFLGAIRRRTVKKRKAKQREKAMSTVHLTSSNETARKEPLQSANRKSRIRKRTRQQGASGGRGGKCQFCRNPNEPASRKGRRKPKSERERARHKGLAKTKGREADVGAVEAWTHVHRADRGPGMARYTKRAL